MKYQGSNNVFCISKYFTFVLCVVQLLEIKAVTRFLRHLDNFFDLKYNNHHENWHETCIYL